MLGEDKLNISLNQFYRQQREVNNNHITPKYAKMYFLHDFKKLTEGLHLSRTTCTVKLRGS